MAGYFSIGLLRRFVGHPFSNFRFLLLFGVPTCLTVSAAADLASFRALITSTHLKFSLQ